MSENLVTRVHTQATPAQMYAAIRDASTPILGEALGRASVLVLLSQWGEETGRGVACWCWNIGNVKHVKDDGRDYFQVRCNEIIGGKTVWIDPPDPGCSFRAFAALATGALDYLTLLHRHFAGAWPDVEAGDTLDFARHLYAQHYYTADQALYARNLAALYAEFDRTIQHDVAPPAPAYVALVVAPIVEIGQPTPPGELPDAV